MSTRPCEFIGSARLQAAEDGEIYFLPLDEALRVATQIGKALNESRPRVRPETIGNIRAVSRLA